MYSKKIIFFFVFFLGATVLLNAQMVFRRIDTTMKIGKAGYRVVCSNKSPLKNTASLSPIGFEKDVRDFSLDIKGRIARTEVDDINRDGYPDLVIYIYNNDSIPKGNVVGITSEKNESLAMVIFPDILDDAKLRVGYKGNDSYFLMEGYLVRRFPVYPVEGAPAAAAGGNLIRQVQYQVIPGERGGYLFKVLRSNDFTKQQ